jgi:hypothetical protein
MPIFMKTIVVLKLNSYWYIQKAAREIIREVPKAASTHIKWFPKFTGVDNISHFPFGTPLIWVQAAYGISFETALVAFTKISRS